MWCRIADRRLFDAISYALLVGFRRRGSDSTVRRIIGVSACNALHVCCARVSQLTARANF